MIQYEMSLNSYSRIASNLTLILIFIIKLSVSHLTSCQSYNHRPSQIDNNNNNNNSELSQRISLNAHNLVIGNNIQATTTTLAPSPLETPDFVEAIGNHTVALGRDAQLSCKINNLGNFRTAWLRVEDKGILTIHNNIITRNYRIGLINNDEGRNFILTIKNVQPSDKGGYMCQINSIPMKYAIGYLDVLTPPFFDDMPLPSTLTSQQDPGIQDKSLSITTTQSPLGAGVITVIEGGNATISCQANGHPSPLITWRREDNEPILLNGASSTLDGVSKVDGSSITLQSVSRLNSGAYLCIASNGVQPSASKRQVLDVQFSPVVRLPQTEIGAALNQKEVKLICFVELNPLGSYYWVKLNSQHSNYQRQTAGNEDDLWLIENEELMQSDKFEIVIKQVNSEKVQMILTIRNVERQDFAWYKCIVKNSLAIQSSSIRLYESSSFSLNNMFRASSSSSTTTTNNFEQQSMDQNQQNDQQQQQQDNKHSTNRGPILSRAHTRSSWIQRGQSPSPFSNRHQEPANALLDSSSSSSSATKSASLPAITSNLLLNCSIFYSYHIIIVLSLVNFILRPQMLN